MSRRRFALALVVLLVAGGCGVWRLTTPDRPAAGIIDVAMSECAIPYPIGQLQATPTATVPDDFVPVAAVTCDPFLGEEVAADRTVGFSEHRWEGDFSRALELLNRRSEHPALFEGGCGRDYSTAALDEFWLIDQLGRAVRPGFPFDSCGTPKPGGLAAIKELTPMGSIEHRIPLSDDQIYTHSRCRPTYQAPELGTEAIPELLSTGNTFCQFSSTVFVGTASTMDTLDGLPTAPRCDAVATDIASTTYSDVSTGQDRLLTVELDGCRRVIADGYAPLQASDALLRSLE